MRKGLRMVNRWKNEVGKERQQQGHGKTNRTEDLTSQEQPYGMVTQSLLLSLSRHSLHSSHLSSLGASPLVPRLSGVNGVSEVSVRHDARDEG